MLRKSNKSVPSFNQSCRNLLLSISIARLSRNVPLSSQTVSMVKRSAFGRTVLFGWCFPTMKTQNIALNRSTRSVFGNWSD